jgi:hypothetical protein
VEDVELRGTVRIRATDSDSVARYLLSATPARDLQITSRGLKDAISPSPPRPRETPDDARRPDPPRSRTRRLLAHLPATGDPPAGRNRRTMIFTLVMPPAFFLLFGGISTAYRTETAGRGNVSAHLMISFAVYGSMIANTSAGASVAVERALGWSRQLRLTPLTPLAYIATKVLTAMVVGAASVAIVFLIGALGGATMPGWVWLVSGLVAWIGAIVFAAFGLFVGYLLPSENVMQFLGPILALLALMGGLFVPLCLV